MKRAELMQRARVVLHATAGHYGLRPLHVCIRCNRRQIDSDILQGYCTTCANALVAKARCKAMANSPLFAPPAKTLKTPGTQMAY